MIYSKKMNSPVGELTLLANDNKLLALVWNAEKSHLHWMQEAQPTNKNAVLNSTEKQLNEYFAGNRRHFDVNVEFKHGTPFQKKVWSALTKIPYGETVSYGHIAKKIGKPKSARAVGAANSKNPVGIIVPCHRVIGSNGTLTGFAGGLPKKKTLLKLEGVECKSRNK